MKLILSGFLVFSFSASTTKRLSIHTPKPNSLHEAVYNRDIDRVKFLIENGTDVNEKEDHRKYTDLYYDTPLFWLQKADIETAKLLIKNGADVNAQSSFNAYFGKDLVFVGPTPLATAIKRDDQKLVFLLKEKGANVGKDYLLYAKSFEIAKLLIDNGADVKAKNKSGYTPMHFAKKPEIVKLLIKNGADVNAGKGTVGVPLYNTYDVKIAKLLIDNGADVNGAGRYGYTPLSNARTVEMAKLLIDNGADLYAVNYEGYALCPDYNKEVKRFLKKRGGCNFSIMLTKKIWHEIKNFFKKKNEE